MPQSKFLSQVLQVGFWCRNRKIWSTHRVDWQPNQASPAWAALGNGYRISVIIETKFWLLRPRLRLVLPQSKFWDWVQDWNSMSLNFETETKTGFIRVSISRPGPRLKLSDSQPRDRVRDLRIGWDRDWDWGWEWYSRIAKLSLTPIFINIKVDLTVCNIHPPQAPWLSSVVTMSTANQPNNIVYSGKWSMCHETNSVWFESSDNCQTTSLKRFVV